MGDCLANHSVHFPDGTRRFSSSNQFSTTWICVEGPCCSLARPSLQPGDPIKHDRNGRFQIVRRHIHQKSLAVGRHIIEFVQSTRLTPLSNDSRSEENSRRSDLKRRLIQDRHSCEALLSR